MGVLSGCVCEEILGVEDLAGLRLVLQTTYSPVGGGTGFLDISLKNGWFADQLSFDKFVGRPISQF